MANSFKFKDDEISIGDTVSVAYKIKEGDKERQQLFKGIVMRIKGSKESEKTIAIRKITRSGIGVERIIPLASPYIAEMKLVKKSDYRKSKLYFIRNLSDKELRSKLYHKK